MKKIISLILWVPLIALAQPKKDLTKGAFEPAFKIAATLNVLSFADIYLPTIQTGIIFSINKKIINELDFGVPIHYKGFFDSLPNWFSHFKIKNSVMHVIGKRMFYVGVVLFYTHLNRFDKYGKYQDDNGKYDYQSAEWKKEIFGYGIKGEKYFRCSKRILLDLSVTLGQRFVNAKIYPKMVNPNPIMAADFGNWFPKTGNFTTPHYELGFKVVYKF